MSLAHSKTLVLVVVLALFLVALAGTAAFAATSYDGQGFGGHVSTMAPTGHLNGDMNPGTHQGVTGYPMPMDGGMTGSGM